MSDILNLLDGASKDGTVSDEAMRWTPQRARFEADYETRRITRGRTDHDMPDVTSPQPFKRLGDIQLNPGDPADYWPEDVEKGRS